MKTKNLGPLCSLILATASQQLLGQAALIHRYSFTADANDSVGTANGTLEGSAAIVDGAVQLDGTSGNYVDLPGGLINGLSAVTFEGWASFGDNGNWNRLFDFGDTSDAGNGRYYLSMIPHSGNGDTRLTVSDVDPGYNHELPIIRPGVLDNLGPQHIVAVFDPPHQIEALYLNGTLAGFRNDLTIPLTSISNVFSYLGRSLYAPDAPMNGSIDEFRIYNDALSPAQIAANFSGGANITNATPGALLSFKVQVDNSVLLNGIAQAAAVASYANATNVSLAAAPGLTFASSDTNILRVSTNGQVTGVSLGSAAVIASYQGTQATQAISVVQVPAVLKHRYSFSDAASSTTVTDSVGTANGALVGGATLDGNGVLTLDGVDGYVDLPNGIISSLTNATFLAWVTWNDAGARFWERIFDFGRSNEGEDLQGTGSTYLFASPRGGAGRARVGATITGGGAGEEFMDSTAVLPSGRQVLLAVTYNYSTRTAKMYIDGQQTASRTVDIPLSSLQDLNNWLGRSQFNDPYFDGQYDEFRIYEGALTDSEVAFATASGPNSLATSPGNLVSISVQATTNSLTLGGIQNLTVFANYQNISNVNVTLGTNTFYASSDSKVLTVETNGLVSAAGIGSASIITTLGGTKTTNLFTVVAAPGIPATPSLAHRYSFNDAASSTTVKDSVGAADGTLINGATLNGSGKLTLNGTDGYVDLPNGIISTLTNATFEAWVTWTDTGRFWERIFDFGISDAGEDAQGNGTTYLILTPRGGANVVRFGTTITGGGAGEEIADGSALLPSGQETHVAVSFNSAAGVAKLYVNGQRVGLTPIDIALSSITDANVWLGRSQFNDPYFNGQYDEFRIWNGAMLDSEVAASFATGPDTLPSENPGSDAQLSIARSGQNLVLSWPATASGYTLETTAALGPQAVWTAVPGNVVPQNSNNTVTIAAPLSTAFYRLKK